MSCRINCVMNHLFQLSYIFLVIEGIYTTEAVMTANPTLHNLVQALPVDKNDRRRTMRVVRFFCSSEFSRSLIWYPIRGLAISIAPLFPLPYLDVIVGDGGHARQLGWGAYGDICVVHRRKIRLRCCSCCYRCFYHCRWLLLTSLPH